MLWGNRTQVSGSGHHPLPTGPAGLLNHLDGRGEKYLDTTQWSVNDDTLILIGLKCATSLIELTIHAPTITDVSPLASLVNVRRFTLTNPKGLQPGSLSALVPTTAATPIHGNPDHYHHQHHRLPDNTNNPFPLFNSLAFSLPLQLSPPTSQLQELNLSKCGAALNDSAMALIAHHHGPCLTHVNISHTHVGDEGAAAISASCHQLVYVNVSHSNIKGKGLNAIMASNRHLVVVQASHLLHCSGRVSLVNITTSGTLAFIRTQLTTLHLNGCDSVRNACCYWLRTFVSLKELDVR